MKISRVTVAVNTDENAPIFEKCEYGIVGDLFEVVPALVEELKKMQRGPGANGNNHKDTKTRRASFS